MVYLTKACQKAMLGNGVIPGLMYGQNPVQLIFSKHSQSLTVLSISLQVGGTLTPIQRSQGNITTRCLRQRRSLFS